MRYHQGLKARPNQPPMPQSLSLVLIHVICSTKDRRNAAIINGSRRKRIALGSGTSVQEVNNLLKQHAQMSKMFKTMGSGGSKMQQRLMSQMGGGQRFGR
jgi:signal recognition particle subunit SRP54